MWINKRTAGTQLGWAGLPAVLFILGLLTFFTQLPLRGEQDGDDDAAKLRTAIDIGGALEIEFFALSGKIYTVEARAAEGTWTSIYGPVTGEGAVIRDQVGNAADYVELRLQVGELAGQGEAPDQIIGHTYSLNYGAAVVALRFATATQGIATAADGTQRAFSFTYKKTLPDEAALLLDFGTGKSEEIRFVFWHGRVGIFQTEVQRPGRRPRKASGTFRAGDDVSPTNALPPLTLEGKKYVFRDRGMTTVINFTTDFSGSLSRQGGDSEVISYTYDISSWPEASLSISRAGTDDSDDYTLVFNARNSGIFKRRLNRDGHNRDTDRGKFSGKGDSDDDDDGKGGGDTETECLAPDSVEGRTLQAVIDGKIQTIVFDGAGSGSILKKRANGRVIFQPFTYSYSKESTNEGVLTITLPTSSDDQTQVFELDFSTQAGGSCVRKLYEGEELDDTDEGTFTLSDDGGVGIADDENIEGDDDDD